MKHFVFVCPDCQQTIEVNDQMRETILKTGCPVCTSTASTADFASNTSESEC
ncbi:DUF7560 family zinc ribbon protein [Natronocalculus amylovorans]|uniref:Zinc ribbon domain-containing protein n=1 Tax=Natronocalculus amylovorans TaxID=2917812 RepID=A0AAE3FZJ5_9EURY|nr:zinc ribbon domain-containing protein [Natronocalculus amylovorans]MCL9818016.1 zinc ribbon domain-containing protein [Natronocalculus amylovorans]